MQQFRVLVINDTESVFKNMCYFDGTTTVKINKEDNEKCISSTEKVSYNYICKNTINMNKNNVYPNKAELMIKSMDSFDVSFDLKRRGLNPVVLNMASADYPGGGYKRGAGAQEESLFRRSCLHLCLDGKQKKELYPIDTTDAIYTNDVIVIKDNELHNYSYYENDYKKMSIITCPAVKCNKNITMVDYDKNVYNIMYKKLDLIFRMAFYYGHDCIVLGAFGCGAYHNPAMKVASICRELYLKYAYCFKNVSFAILSDHNDIFNSRRFNSYTNYEAFELVLA